MTRFSQKEILLFALISTLIMAWSSIPNWAGYLAQNDRSAFGGTYFDAADYAVHIAMMQAGMQGAWGYNLRFTTEPHQTAYIRMFYIVLGQINRLLHASPAFGYQIARWLFGYTALLSIYTLTKCSFDRDGSRWQWLAFSLAVLGSGLGWLQTIFGWNSGLITPIDFWLIDGYVLFSLSIFPHFAFTLTLMCLAYTVYLAYLQNGGRLRIAAVILAALLVQFVNPVAFIVIDIAIATATLVDWSKRDRLRRSRWDTLAVIALAQIPLLIYNFYILRQDPIWSQFTAQNETLSPPAIYYLWGFGLFWPFALIGSIHAFRQSSTILLSSLAWIVGAFALAYSPFPIQRRFLLGITIPLALLAARGLLDCFQFISHRNIWLSRRIPSLTLIAGLLFSFTPMVFSLAEAHYMLSRPRDYFYPRGLDLAFKWIAGNTHPADFVLTAVRTGQLVAQISGRKVFLGHEMETLSYGTKLAEVEAFYRGELPPAQFLQCPIRWVVYGPYERTIAPDFSPGPQLELVFQAQRIQIFKNLICSNR
jgi:hypothetical protein